jgi:hypothetical protein
VQACWGTFCFILRAKGVGDSIEEPDEEDVEELEEEEGSGFFFFLSLLEPLLSLLEPLLSLLESFLSALESFLSVLESSTSVTVSSSFVGGIFLDLGFNAPFLPLPVAGAATEQNEPSGVVNFGGQHLHGGFMINDRGYSADSMVNLQKKEILVDCIFCCFFIMIMMIVLNSFEAQ